MKNILIFIIGVFLYTPLYADDFLVDNYKEVKVNHIKWLCSEWDYGCYYYWWAFEWQINISKYLSEWHYKYILSHEYWHYLWYKKMKQKDRLLYMSLFTDPVKKQLRSKWLDINNCSISEYAKTSIKEDFAEAFFMYEYHKPKQIKNICHLRIYLVWYYFNKYSW